MGRLMTVATCSLNQWVLDWEGNLARIKESIHVAKERGATLRVGPELEICGYGCLDHFLEGDLYLHCWEMMLKILTDESLYEILLDIGMPVIHRNVRYNCRVIVLNGKILLIRPKLHLANDGNYRENRFFTTLADDLYLTIGPWGRPQVVEEYFLPRMIATIQGTQKCPIGDAVISTLDTCFGVESCEEIWTPKSPHTDMSLNGVEIISNSSGSHHNLRKLDQRIALIQEATRKNGGIYLYSNQQGCDGDRLYYDGCALIVVNGSIVSQGSQFSLNDVEVVTAIVDIEEVRSFRCMASRGFQATAAPTYDRVECSFSLSGNTDFDLNIRPSPTQKLKIHKPEEEISMSAACWMWDYLRRSGQAGFLIPLSGGIDSCATATLVFSMCRLVVSALPLNPQVVADVQRIAGRGEKDWLPSSPQELCNRILHAVYMGMKTQSSAETRSRAKRLAEDTGAYFVDMNIDSGFSAIKGFLPEATGFTPNFRAHGGSNTENLALQNIQARTRMVTAYYFAQMLPQVRGFSGSLLVLGSANVDECLRGYLTKYDCSSADINPIGGVSKTDLIAFIVWATTEFSLPILEEFVTAIPTAELEPITEDYVQSDEADMGFTYVELSILGRLRKEEKLGPYSAFTKLLHLWSAEKTPRETADKVKRFFHYWAINRHKMTTMTPSLHLETYSPDDNRYDLRPFCYPAFYKSWSYKKIDALVEKLEKAEGESVNNVKAGP